MKLGKLVGAAMLLGGVYFFGQDIFFVGPYGGIAAMATVVCLAIGIFLLLFVRGAALLGWMGIGLGILLVFTGARAFLEPTSLWDFCLGTTLMAAGYKLFKDGDISI